MTMTMTKEATASQKSLPPLARCRPLNDRIIVRLDEQKTKSDSGILLPETARSSEPPSQGTVIRVGPGRLFQGGQGDPLMMPKDGRVPMQIKEGDRVLFSRYSASTVGDDETHVIIREDDVMGVLES